MGLLFPTYHNKCKHAAYDVTLTSQTWPTVKTTDSTVKIHGGHSQIATILDLIKNGNHAGH